MEINTVEEVAQKLKLSVLTIRKHLREGKLKGAKIGKHWRVTDQQIIDYLDKNINGEEVET